MNVGPLHLDNPSVCPCLQVMALQLTKQFILVEAGSLANFLLIKQDKSGNTLFFLVLKNPILEESVEFLESCLCSCKKIPAPLQV